MESCSIKSDKKTNKIEIRQKRQQKLKWKTKNIRIKKNGKSFDLGKKHFG